MRDGDGREPGVVEGPGDVDALVLVDRRQVLVLEVEDPGAVSCTAHQVAWSKSTVQVFAAGAGAEGGPDLGGAGSQAGDAFVPPVGFADHQPAHVIDCCR